MQQICNQMQGAILHTIFKLTQRLFDESKCKVDCHCFHTNHEPENPGKSIAPQDHRAPRTLQSPKANNFSADPDITKLRQVHRAPRPQGPKANNFSGGHHLTEFRQFHRAPRPTTFQAGITLLILLTFGQDPYIASHVQGINSLKLNHIYI